MNDRQNTVVATTVVSLILVLVYLCPWRVETSGEIQWSPMYQPPISYTRTYDPEYGTEGGSRMESEETEIAYGILALELPIREKVRYFFSRIGADRVQL